MPSPRTLRGSAAAGWLGFLVLAGGLAILVATFQQAWDLYHTPPKAALGLEGGKPITLEDTAPAAIGVLIRILLLVAMALIGSLISARGIQLLTAPKSRGGSEDQ